MSQKSIVQIAEGFGLTVETVARPDTAAAFRVMKGSNQVFVGTEEAARTYLANYEKGRPALYEGSIYGYKE